MSTNSHKLTHILSPLHFLHIPKTGGQSVSAWLRKYFAEETIFPYHFLRELERVKASEIAQYQLFSGHFGINWHDRLPCPPSTITWLRNPVQREISQYFYLKSNQKLLLEEYPLNPYGADYVKATNQLSLSALLQSPLHLGRYDNLQVRSLAGFFPVTDLKPTPCDQQMLSAAQETLKKLLFFGFTEKMTLSLALLSYILGAPPSRYDLHLNRSQQEDVVSASVLEIARAVNNYDQKLYDFACALFEERYSSISSHISDGDGRLNSEKVNLFLFKEFQERNKNINAFERIAFDWGQTTFLNNWHPRFYYEPLQKWLRWTGPGLESTIYLPLASNKDLQLKFNAYYSLVPNLAECLTLTVNNMPIALTPQMKLGATSNHSYYEFTGLISASVLASGPYAELKFIVPKTYPMELDLHQSWQVGFACDGVTIDPNLEGMETTLDSF